MPAYRSQSTDAYPRMRSTGHQQVFLAMPRSSELELSVSGDVKLGAGYSAGSISGHGRRRSGIVVGYRQRKCSLSGTAWRQGGIAVTE